MLIQTVPPQNSAYPRIRFYAALCYLELGKTKAATEELKLISNSPDHPLRFEAQWYLGLAWLKAEQADKAEAVFRAMQKQGNSYNAEKVRALLNQF